MGVLEQAARRIMSVLDKIEDSVGDEFEYNSESVIRFDITRNENRLLPRDAVWNMTGASKSMCDRFVETYSNLGKRPNAAIIHNNYLYFLWTNSPTGGVEGRIEKVKSAGNKTKVLEDIVNLYVDIETKSLGDPTGLSDEELGKIGTNIEFRHTEFTPTVSVSKDDDIGIATTNISGSDLPSSDSGFVLSFGDSDDERIKRVLAQSVLDAFNIADVVWDLQKLQYTVAYKNGNTGSIHEGRKEAHAMLTLWAIKTLKIG